MKGIDWNKQWSLFCPHFSKKKNMTEVPLPPFGTVRLLPGPGFGDLSHPTTRLTLQLMQQMGLSGRPFLDVGCGSGILSLAAAAMGASQVIGVDCDPEALVHAQANASLNQVTEKVAFYTNTEMRPMQSPVIAAMNMIVSEQQNAYALIPRGSSVITSGVLASQEKAYLETTKAWGWTYISHLEKEGWLAFVFS